MGVDILQVKKVALHTTLIIILQESESIHIMLYLHKKHWLFMLYYSLSQFLIRIKITKYIFRKRFVRGYTQFFFKWIFVYYKCYISIELTYLKELMLRNMNQKNVIFVTIGIF